MAAGCRDCAMCTGHAFTGAGRSFGRGLADLSTLGITHLARRTCKPCGHPMSEHLGKSAELVVTTKSDVRNETRQARGWVASQKAIKPNPARWILQSDGRYRWWTGDAWSGDFTNDPGSPAPVAAAATVLAVEAAATLPVVDPVAQLKQLAELRDAGILSEQEFAAKKTEILGRM